jgi:hypothetical protein
MAKKVIKGKSLKKKIVKKTPKNKNIEKILIENFVSLQKVMTNLALKFDELSDNISKLLSLFESSANSLAKKEINIGKPMNEKQILEKLENLSNQNKTIAKGLTLMYEEKKPEVQSEKTIPIMQKKPLQSEIYQKSPFPQNVQ